MELIEARFHKKLTQYTLSGMCGIAQSKLSLFENGYLIPTSEERNVLAKALKVNPEELEFYKRSFDQDDQASCERKEACQV